MSARHFRRLTIVAATSALALSWVSAATAAAAAAVPTLTVCAHGCSYTHLAPAVVAAPPGATIRIGAGTYRGGFAITKSLTLSGAGAGRTVIRGGGPVITIGAYAAILEPTDVIRGVTITGGVTHTSPITTSSALGGGVFIPPSANSGIGATLTLQNSIIAGNTAQPSKSVPSTIACPTGPCRFAIAGGGGIDSWGTVTVDHTVIRDNSATGTITSDADGGGIYVQRGALTMRCSVVTVNQSIAGVPNGRFAEGGGIEVDTSFSGDGTASLSVSNSTVDANRAALTSTLPSVAGGALIDMNANGGGIHVGDNIPTTIERTAIDANTVTATDPNGEPIGIDAAMIIGNSPLTMRDTLIQGNRTTTTALTSSDVGPSGDALELDGPGTITNTRIVDNITTSVSPGGVAGAIGALAILPEGTDDVVAVQDSVISDNITHAASATGSATAQGSGIFTNGLLRLRGVQVHDNVARANAPTGLAQGAGIWNGVDIAGPPVQLTATDSTITGNSLTGSPGISRQGGGLYTTEPVTLTRTRIVGNRPNQCVGCPRSPQAPARCAGGSRP